MLLLVGVRDFLPFFPGAPTEEAEPEAEPEEAATATAAGEDDPLLIAGADGAGDL